MSTPIFFLYGHAETSEHVQCQGVNHLKEDYIKDLVKTIKITQHLKIGTYLFNVLKQI